MFPLKIKSRSAFQRRVQAVFVRKIRQRNSCTDQLKERAQLVQGYVNEELSREYPRHVHSIEQNRRQDYRVI